MLSCRGAPCCSAATSRGCSTPLSVATDWHTTLRRRTTQPCTRVLAAGYDDELQEPADSIPFQAQGASLFDSGDEVLGMPLSPESLLSSFSYDDAFGSDLGFAPEPDMQHQASAGPSVPEAAEIDPEGFLAQLDFDYEASLDERIHLATQKAFAIHHRHNQASHNKFSTTIEFARVLQEIEMQEALHGTDNAPPETAYLPSWVSTSFVFDEYFDEWNESVLRNMKAADRAKETTDSAPDATGAFHDAVNQIYAQPGPSGSDREEAQQTSAPADPLEAFLGPLTAIAQGGGETPQEKPEVDTSALDEVLPGASDMQGGGEEEAELQEVELDF